MNDHDRLARASPQHRLPLVERSRREALRLGLGGRLFVTRDVRPRHGIETSHALHLRGAVSLEELGRVRRPGRRLDEAVVCIVHV